MKIPLTKGQYVEVDTEDYAVLTKHKWQYRDTGNRGYASRTIRLPDGRYRATYMQRWLLNAGAGDEVAFVNGDSLDCRRSNLKLCQHNDIPRIKIREHTSKYLGVSWYTRDQKWRALINLYGKPKHLGTFDDEEEAARAYDDAARERYGENAKVNFQ